MKANFLLPLAALTLLAACSTAGLNRRKAEHAQTYQSLTETERQHVDRGELSEGMGMEAVVIAWGEPSKTTAGAAPSQTLWIYEGSYVRKTPHWSYEPNRLGYGRLEYHPRHSSHRFTRAEVLFRESRVTSWKKFDPPNAY